MPDLEGLTIKELDMLTDGLTSWEHMQHSIPHFLNLPNQEASEEDKIKLMAEVAENERRGIMEAATLLKAKLIGRKTVLQSESATSEALGHDG